jgi:hypothetical protein
MRRSLLASEEPPTAAGPLLLAGGLWGGWEAHAAGHRAGDDASGAQ